MNNNNNNKNSGGRSCARHPYLPVVGVCACCLRDRLNLLAAVAAADDDYELPTGVRDEVDDRYQKKGMLLHEAMMIHLQAPRSPLPTGGGRHSNACHLERYRVVNRLLLPPARHSDASAYGQRALHQLRQKLQEKDRERDRPVKDEESVSQAPANPKKKRNPFWFFPTPKKTPLSASSSLQSAASSSSSTSTSTSWISSLFPSRRRRHSHHIEAETGDPSVFIAGRPSTVDGLSVASSVNWINHNRRKPLRTCIYEDEEDGDPPCQLKLDENSTATTATDPAAAFPKKDHSAYKLGLSFISKPFSRRHRSFEDHNGTSVHPSPFHRHGTPLLPPPPPFSSRKIKE